MAIFVGVDLALSLLLTWAAVFVPVLLGRGQLAARVGICSIVFLLCQLLVPHSPENILGFDLGPNFSFIAQVFLDFPMPLLILGIHEILTAWRKWPRTAIPAYSILFLLFTAWAPVRLHAVAQKMWTAPDPGSVRYVDVDELAALHLFMILVALAAAIALWILCWRWPPRKLLMASLLTFAGLLLSTIAFYQTVPRGGDEWVMLWFLFVPAGAIVAGLSAVSCLLTPLICHMRARRQPPRGLEVVR